MTFEAKRNHAIEVGKAKRIALLAAQAVVSTWKDPDAGPLDLVAPLSLLATALDDVERLGPVGR